MTHVAVTSETGQVLPGDAGHGHGFDDGRVALEAGSFSQSMHVRCDLDFVGKAAGRKGVGVQKSVHRFGGVWQSLQTATERWLPLIQPAYCSRIT